MKINVASRMRDREFSFVVIHDLLLGLNQEWHDDGCHMWSRTSLPCRRTWVHPRFL